MFANFYEHLLYSYRYVQIQLLFNKLPTGHLASNTNSFSHSLNLIIASLRLGQTLYIKGCLEMNMTWKLAGQRSKSAFYANLSQTSQEK